MFDPDAVRIVIDELCEEMELKNACTESCKKCPLSTNNAGALDRNVDLFNNEL